MKISFNNMLYAMSLALDKVESEFLGVTSYHSPRVAYIATQIGAQFGLEPDALSDLAACSILHDNALTEYIRDEFDEEEGKGKDFGAHCVVGEQNASEMMFFGDVKNCILYHHENFDGSGQFGKKGDEIPFLASLVRLGDSLDLEFDMSVIDKPKYHKIMDFVEANAGVLYDPAHAELFVKVFTLPKLESMQGEGIIHVLKGSLPEYMTDYTPEQLVSFPKVFAKIIDYKSPFTKNHSVGVAKRAAFMGKHYGFDKEHVAKLFLAGALHDIGKMVVDNAILEKPSGLTPEEFETMKDHAYYSFKILNDIKGFQEVARWGAFHHETLDGRGYRFGLDAEQLGFEERLMACIDIYQALSEERPYKPSFSHEKIMSILRDMAGKGKVDEEIVNNIDEVFARQNPVLSDSFI